VSRNVGLDQAIEVVLSIGLVVSAVLMLAGLAAGAQDPLRWGILLLMLTPVARVVVLTLGLFQARDWFFGALSLGILGVLVFSMVLGARYL
jgi:uncharacterized membrane protein